MINFLEKNKRLPISVVEVRQTTRFCGFCGSRKKVKGITETFVQEIMTAILIVIINFVIVQKCKNVNQTLLLFDMLLLCSGIAYINGVLIKKCDFIIKPLLNLLDIVIQCSNTTKNVERKDIILAYFAAKYWMKAVYPEFYVEDDSICETD